MVILLIQVAKENSFIQHKNVLSRWTAFYNADTRAQLLQNWIVLVNLIIATCSTKKDVVCNREVLATMKPIDFCQ